MSCSQATVCVCVCVCVCVSVCVKETVIAMIPAHHPLIRSLHNTPSRPAQQVACFPFLGPMRIVAWHFTLLDCFKEWSRMYDFLTGLLIFYWEGRRAENHAFYVLARLSCC